jgi:hypothetical protein
MVHVRLLPDYQIGAGSVTILWLQRVSANEKPFASALTLPRPVNKQSAQQSRHALSQRFVVSPAIGKGY